MTQGSTTTESYTYDKVGNRLSSLGVSPYAYNSSNELTSYPSVNYTYDYNGNTLTRVNSAGTTSYTWDYENRLTKVVLPGSGGTVTFQYDPFGRRIQKGSPSGTTNYLYDGPEFTASVIEEVDNAGNVLARYTHDLDVDSPLSMLRSGATSYFERDGLGSITSLSNGAGALGNTYTFDSFGKLTASTGTLTNPFQFAGREFDQETGLYYDRARYYDQNAGRFISEDPIRFRGGIDFYAYVGNNPINRTDPDGMGDTPKSCAKALAELAAAQAQASARWAKFVAFGDKDPGHTKALAQALHRLQKAIDDVKKYCNCDALKVEAAAAIAAAMALAEEIADAIRQFCSQEPCFAP